MRNRIYALYALEQLSSRSTYIHRLHPLVKILATAVFIITVISFDRYAPGRLVPYIFYIAILMALSETPYGMLLKRFLVALPFCLALGVSNILFDRTAAFAIGGVMVSWGIISFSTILFRTFLCVMAVLILVSVTPFSALTGEMKRLRMPAVFITMFEMTYRYIGVISDEACSMYTAYSLRSAYRKGIEMKNMSSFAGQLFIRSFDRADRVYMAMKCRGYALQNKQYEDPGLTRNDIGFCIVSCSLCLLFRFIDINKQLAGILERAFNA
jgi:cobalt/nickel transport system permease protein